MDGAVCASRCQGAFSEKMLVTFDVRLLRKLHIRLWNVQGPAAPGQHCGLAS